MLDAGNEGFAEAGPDGGVNPRRPLVLRVDGANVDDSGEVVAPADIDLGKFRLPRDGIFRTEAEAAPTIRDRCEERDRFRRIVIAIVFAVAVGGLVLTGGVIALALQLRGSRRPY